MIDVKSYLKKPYSRVVTPDESGLFTGRILELPGCFAEGRSPAEAYANLDSAAESWLLSADANGIAIPDPFVLADYSGTVSLRLPKSIHRRASEHARREGVSLNQFLVSSISVSVGARDVVPALLSRFDDFFDRLELDTTRRIIYWEMAKSQLAGGMVTPSPRLERRIPFGKPTAATGKWQALSSLGVG